MAKSTSPKDFAVIEIVLVVVILAMVGFTGWFVWHSKQQTEASLSNTANTHLGITKKIADKQTATKQSDETANWLLYTAPGNEFTIRLADGWKLERYQKSAALYTFSNANLTPAPGTKAIVTEVSGGKDGPGEGLSISFVDKASDLYRPSSSATKFTTAAGDVVEVYSSIEDSSTIQGLGQLDKGGTYYTYIISKSATKNMSITYGVNPGQTDYHALVETVINTLRIN